MARVGIYVQARYAKPTYARESYDARYWPGLEMIRDAVERAGHEVHYCSAANVGDHPVVLASITSACDWWTFIAEQSKWGRRPRVIVGGAGVLNVRPVLFAADAFVFGRGEGIIGPMLAAELRGEQFEHESVCYAASFRPEHHYRIAQAEAAYPHPVRLSRGGEWTETAIGCQRRCLFCGYTWHRRHVGGAQAESGAGNSVWKSSLEQTIWELEPFTADKLRGVRLVGIDGLSERLRRMVAKPITRDMLRRLLVGLSPPGGHAIRLYSLVGLPTEGAADWNELMDVVAEADSLAAPRDNRRWVGWFSTPFRAMPATPCSGWPMRYEDFRPEPRSRYLKIREGSAFNFGTWPTVDSLPTHALDALLLRGVEADQDAVRRLACTPAFWSAKTMRRRVTLEKHLDIDRLYRRYSYDELPTRYLDGYVPLRDMLRAGDKALDSEVTP